ncbi:MAG: bifunctional folylpolyglutamate synthase/dihydrofolate synthase, partial [Fimbriimonadaceae bacterium]
FAGVTEFEFKTALGFLAWQRTGAEWVALETGLGGRLDATNVVTPAASVIVSIGLDHVSILGDTIEKIALEKAGIVKRGVPLVLGSVDPGAGRVIEEVAAQLGSPVWRFGREIAWDAATRAVVTPRGSFDGLETGLQGVWQNHNLSLAVAALVGAGLELSVETARVGAATAFAPGRYEKKRWNDRTVILDGAHNADSSSALVRTLQSDFGSSVRVVLLSNMLIGHEPAAFYRPLATVSDLAVIAPLDFHRRRDPGETVSVLEGLGVQAEASDSVQDALKRCVQLAGPERPILVTGSFYLVGEVARAMAATDPPVA